MIAVAGVDTTRAHESPAPGQIAARRERTRLLIFPRVARPSAFNPTLQTAMSLCDDWPRPRTKRRGHFAWCGTCTQTGVNCFTGSNSCQGPYDSTFCRLNMAGTVCAETRPGGRRARKARAGPPPTSIRPCSYAALGHLT